MTDRPSNGNKRERNAEDEGDKSDTSDMPVSVSEQLAAARLKAKTIVEQQKTTGPPRRKRNRWGSDQTTQSFTSLPPVTNPEVAKALEDIKEKQQANELQQKLQRFESILQDAKPPTELELAAQELSAALESRVRAQLALQQAQQQLEANSLGTRALLLSNATQPLETQLALQTRAQGEQLAAQQKVLQAQHGLAMAHQRVLTAQQRVQTLQTLHTLQTCIANGAIGGLLNPDGTLNKAVFEAPPPAEFQKGDWICDSCHNHNYKDKTKCNRCSAPRPLDKTDPEELAKAEPLFERAKLFYHGTDGHTKHVQDLPLAVQLLQQSACLGYAPAQHLLGRFYAEGIGVEKDLAKALSLYTEAAQQDNAEGQTALAFYHARGLGGQKDMQQAFSWFKRAAEQGHAIAQYNLGICYLSGKGVAEDAEKAVESFRKAADQKDADAMCKLGVCYAEGKGVKQSHKKAAKLFQKAADQTGHAGAQTWLGLCYEHARGVEQDVEKAVALYLLAADQGHAPALLELERIEPKPYQQQERGR
eukprot:g68672.t1